MDKTSHRLIIAITGASGVRYGVRLLELLKPLEIETHLVLSRTAEVTLACETDLKIAQVQALADHCHAATDMAAAISSGSFRTMGMIIAPPVPAFYAKPASLEAMVDHTLGRMLDLFDIDAGSVTRWGEGPRPPRTKRKS